MPNNKYQSGLLMLREEKKEEGHKSPEEMKKVVMNGAKLLCPFHPAPGTLVVTSNQVRLQGNIWATSADNKKTNFLFTGLCLHPSFGSAKPPCIGVITPLIWEKTGTIKVQDNPTLLKESKIKCGISNQYITILHDGQTAVPSVLMNLSQDLVNSNMSDCSDSVRIKLQNEVEKYCKSQKTKCLKEDSCATLEGKMDRFNNCMQARIKINTKCFKGGDFGHNKAIADAINGLIRCQEIFFPKCTDSFKEPVPIPPPIPQEDKDYMKRMAEITGLTGAALIIYVIISEGSRLYPPRNLVPVP